MCSIALTLNDYISQNCRWDLRSRREINEDADFKMYSNRRSMIMTWNFIFKNFCMLLVFNFPQTWSCSMFVCWVYFDFLCSCAAVIWSDHTYLTGNADSEIGLLRGNWKRVFRLSRIGRANLRIARFNQETLIELPRKHWQSGQKSTLKEFRMSTRRAELMPFFVRDLRYCPTMRAATNWRYFEAIISLIKHIKDNNSL